eukprot:TRINITY_DN106421_c0_g1_i1.p1 TRINITY_DN106421_c0_g1~~TRINITY_DN106421_c0_g1_i1.p1  ORF type:complete len:573 (-),score=93.77 TRINITY_DN106421_c0_g1_i1:228-1946(-)
MMALLILFLAGLSIAWASCGENGQISCATLEPKNDEVHPAHAHALPTLVSVDGCTMNYVATKKWRPASYNFANEYHYGTIFAPSSVEELQDHVLTGNATCFLPQATGHGAGPCAGPKMPNCTIVSFRHLKNFSIVKGGKDCDGPAILRTQPGVIFADVLPALESLNLTLHNYGSIALQTVLGAALTGTHGSGTEATNNFISALSVIPASGPLAGSLRRLSSDPKNETSQEAGAWLVPLGGLGFVVEADFQLQPNFNLEVGEPEAVPLSKIPEAPSHADKTSYLSLASLKEMSDVLVYRRAHRTTAAVNAMRTAASSEDYKTTANAWYAPMDNPEINWLLPKMQSSFLTQRFAAMAGWIPTGEHKAKAERTADTKAPRVYTATNVLTRKVWDSNDWPTHCDMEMMINAKDIPLALRRLQELRSAPDLDWYQSLSMELRVISPDFLDMHLSAFKKNVTRIATDIVSFRNSGFTGRMEGGSCGPSFAAFCDFVLEDLICKNNVDLKLHRGKFMPERWIGSQELEGDMADGWQKYQDIRKTVDPLQKASSRLLELWEERIPAGYRACATPRKLTLV